MGRRKGARVRVDQAEDVRRCNFTLTPDMDMKLTIFARAHRLTRSQAVAQAVAMLTQGVHAVGVKLDAPRESEPVAEPKPLKL